MSEPQRCLHRAKTEIEDFIERAAQFPDDIVAEAYRIMHRIRILEINTRVRP